MLISKKIAHRNYVCKTHSPAQLFQHSVFSKLVKHRTCHMWGAKCPVQGWHGFLLYSAIAQILIKALVLFAIRCNSKTKVYLVHDPYS